MSFLFKKPKNKPIPTEVLKKCDVCDGKGYIKYKMTETDGWALKYGAPKHYTEKEPCKNCNSTGKIILVIPRKE